MVNILYLMKKLILVIKFILLQVLNKFKLISFQVLWKVNNYHNFTSVSKIFPLNCVDVGKKSYGELKVYSYSNGLNEKLIIGNYVSIANNVSFILGGNHNFDTITTYPLKSFVLNDHYKDTFSKGPIIIEDDVWIGFGVIILSGVKVGKGAIIAAGSVVTKNVPPYALIGGNPAKIIKYRFDGAVIDQLLKLDLSEFSDAFIQQNISTLYSKINSPKDLDFYFKNTTSTCD